MEAAVELHRANKKPVPEFYIRALELSADTVQVRRALQIVEWMNRDSVLVC